MCRTLRNGLLCGHELPGNGVTVTVVEAIGRNLKAVDEELRLEDTVYAD